MSDDKIRNLEEEIEKNVKFLKKVQENNETFKSVSISRKV